MDQITSPLASKISLDWMQFTCPHDLMPSDVCPASPAFDIVARCQSLRNYDIAFELRCGAKINVSETRSEHMGINVMLNGSTLRTLRNQYAITDDASVAWSQSIARKFSRVDVALDVPVRISPRVIKADCASGKITTRMKLHTLYEMSDAPHAGGGVYFGSPKSHRRIVIYDKAAEMGMLNEALTRVELRTRNRAASHAVAAIKELGIEIGGRKLMSNNFDYSAPWFQSAIADLESVELPEPAQKPDKWREWILSDVVKSCENRLGTHRDAIVELRDRLDNLLQ